MWRIPKAYSSDATSVCLLRRRAGQSERDIQHQNRFRAAGDVEEVLRKVTGRNTPTALQEFAPVAECREVAAGRVGEQLFSGEDTCRNAERELFLKHQSHAITAYRSVHGTPAFLPAGKEVLFALDGRAVRDPQAVAICRAPKCLRRTGR